VTSEDSAEAGNVPNQFSNGMATGSLATAIGADTTLGAAITEFLTAVCLDDGYVARFVLDGNSHVVHADVNSAAGNIVELVCGCDSTTRNQY